MELMAQARRQDGTKFRNQVLKPLLKAGWLEMTVPDKPASRRQKYRTTDAFRWPGYFWPWSDVLKLQDTATTGCLHAGPNRE
ncbi:MAG: hypothetical protein OXQ31_08950 [Spirochaetaceae bacterium]|nr:hypothetical protein [Spirochaetaceae bacterium]